MDGIERLSDGHLLEAAHAGDRRAFGALVDRHKDGLVTYLTRVTGCPDDAEDLAQESFIRLYERGSGYRDEGKLRAYLFRIGTNLVRGRERQKRRRHFLRSVFFSSNGHRDLPAQQARLLQEELRRQLSTAIAELPLRYRTPFVLHEVEGWSYREIGALTGSRLGTVKSRIHRGRRLLRERLRPHWQGGQAE